MFSGILNLPKNNFFKNATVGSNLFRKFNNSSQVAFFRNNRSLSRTIIHVSLSSVQSFLKHDSTHSDINNFEPRKFGFILCFNYFLTEIANLRYFRAQGEKWVELGKLDRLKKKAVLTEKQLRIPAARRRKLK